MNFIGIDPGQSGGIAVIRSTSTFVTFAKFKGQSEQDMVNMFNGIKVECAHPVVYLEQVHAMPRQGVSSTFKFGASYGFLRGLCVSQGFKINDVTPQKWQKALGCLTGGDKNVSKRKAQQLFPALAHRITHAVADALLLAVYAEQVTNGEIKWIGS